MTGPTVSPEDHAVAWVVYTCPNGLASEQALQMITQEIARVRAEANRRVTSLFTVCPQGERVASDMWKASCLQCTCGAYR